MDRTTARKAPRQDRARVTVDVILATAAHILVHEGFEAFTTNHIAKRAGVSVGSLYQYFQNKESILAALVDGHERKMMGILADSIENLAALPVREAVGVYIRTSLAVHADDHDLHRALIYALPSIYSTEDVLKIHERAVPIVRAYLHAKRDEIDVVDVDVAAHLLVTTVESATHTVTVEHPERIRDGTLERELTTLITRYLGVDGARVARSKTPPKSPGAKKVATTKAIRTKKKTRQ